MTMRSCQMKIRKKLQLSHIPLFQFTKEMLRHPREIGALCPSSPHLAAAMAESIPDGKGMVIELGAGTGSVTNALVSRGIAASDILVLERSPDFCRILHDKSQGMSIVQGDAASLCSFIPQDIPVRAVVSSLPLMNFSLPLRERILTQIRRALGEYGCVIQFTYALFSRSPYVNVGFQRDMCRIITLNVPPAKVERFHC